MWIFLFLGAFANFQKATLSFVMSVRTSVCPTVWNISAPTGQTYMKFDIGSIFFENLSRKFKFH